MAGLLQFSSAGLAFILVGAADSLSSSSSPPPFIIRLRSVAVALVSFLALVNALFASVSAHAVADGIGAVAQLNTAAVSAIFLLYSYASRVSPLSDDVVGFFAFSSEFLLFYFRSSDSAGLENRYYDLLLIPVAVSALSSLFCSSDSRWPRLIRGLGIVMQGTWMVQVAFSFFSTAVAHGCKLKRRSRGSFTVTCRGHAEYHRGRAVATLQFNCHLALLVIGCLVVYAVVFGGGEERRRGKYEALTEMRKVGQEEEGYHLGEDEGGVLPSGIAH